jgi:hypothetical protein
MDTVEWEKKIRDMEAVDVDALSGGEFENYLNYALPLLANWEGISPAQDRRLRACTRRVMARMKAEAQFLRVRSQALDLSIRAGRRRP